MQTVKPLKIAITLFAVVGLGLFASIFFGYLSPSEESTDKTRLTRSFTDISAAEIRGLSPGDEKKFQVGGWVLGVYRPTDEAWEDLEALDDLVYSPEITTYFGQLDLFIYWRHAPHCGFVTSHRRKDEDDFDKIWLGGYWDDPHGSSFDYAGRSIKDHDFALRGYSMKSRNLSAPKIEIRRNGSIRIRHDSDSPFG